jgi:hypothetical protein
MRRVILMIIFLGLLPFGCWEKVLDIYYEINDLTCQVFKDDSLSILIQPTDTVSNNQVFFKINMTYDYIADNRALQYFIFSRSLYAFSKGRPGRDGLKEKLSSIKIYSNNSFNGHVAGSDIKELFKWHDVQWDGQQKSIDSLVMLLNKTAFFVAESPYFLKLVLKEKPLDSLQHIFSFDFLYQNGQHQLVSSTMINWK